MSTDGLSLSQALYALHSILKGHAYKQPVTNGGHGSKGAAAVVVLSGLFMHLVNVGRRRNDESVIVLLSRC